MTNEPPSAEEVRYTSPEPEKKSAPSVTVLPYASSVVYEPEDAQKFTAFVSVRFCVACHVAALKLSVGE